MNTLTEKTIHTQDGEKTISVHVCDILDLDEPLDVMTLSCFYRDYQPVPGTLFGALAKVGIQVIDLGKEPQIDLRKPCNIWLSGEIGESRLPIRRIGCIESSSGYRDKNRAVSREEQMITSLQAYFRMLDIASIAGVEMKTVGLPILGGGNQSMDIEKMAVPVINESLGFLKTNRAVQSIRIITRNQGQAFRFGMALEQSYLLHREIRESAAAAKAEPREGLAFISYSSKDKNVADNLCAKLEARGMRVWYAPRDIKTNDYATAIVDAITRCSHFVVILSRNSVQSQHVLNEIDLGFKELQRGVRFLPFKIDEEEMGPAFMYYLSRQHWMDAHVPPLEARLEEFAGRF